MANRQKHVLSLEVVKNEVTSQNISSEVLQATEIILVSLYFQ